ncbi:MAG: hypothetical protein NVSMB16_03950 [Acidimicrobiales bacterium]
MAAIGSGAPGASGSRDPGHRSSECGRRTVVKSGKWRVGRQTGALAGLAAAGDTRAFEGLARRHDVGRHPGTVGTAKAAAGSGLTLP